MLPSTMRAATIPKDGRLPVPRCAPTQMHLAHSRQATRATYPYSRVFQPGVEEASLQAGLIPPLCPHPSGRDPTCRRPQLSNLNPRRMPTIRGDFRNPHSIVARNPAAGRLRGSSARCAHGCRAHAEMRAGAWRYQTRRKPPPDCRRAVGHTNPESPASAAARTAGSQCRCRARNGWPIRPAGSTAPAREHVRKC